MGMIEGTGKYIIGVLLAPPSFVAMYLFGGGIITFFETAKLMFSGKFIEAFIEYYIMSALPPTSLGQVLITASIGASIAGILWFIGMVRHHQKVTF